MKILGTSDMPNAPGSMRGIAHWLGGDDWPNLEAYCRGLIAAMKKIQAEGNVIRVEFGDKTLIVPLDFIECADAMFMDGEQGHDGFAGEEPCITCRG